MNRIPFFFGLLISSVSLTALGSTEWAAWNTAASNLASTGSFADGRTVELVSFFATIGGPQAPGTAYSGA